MTIIAKIDDISNDNIFRSLFDFIEVFPQHKCVILRNHILEFSVVAEHIFLYPRDPQVVGGFRTLVVR